MITAGQKSHQRRIPAWAEEGCAGPKAGKGKLVALTKQQHSRRLKQRLQVHNGNLWTGKGKLALVLLLEDQAVND